MYICIYVCIYLYIYIYINLYIINLEMTKCASAVELLNHTHHNLFLDSVYANLQISIYVIVDFFYFKPPRTELIDKQTYSHDVQI